MSRLTKEQAIKYYGQNLPTPTIDRITLTNITHTDEIYTELNAKTVLDAAATEAPYATGGIAGFGPPSMVNFSKLVKVTVSLSFRFSTWEGFDISELTKELFDTIMTVEGTDESLYASILITKNGVPPTASISKTGICQTMHNVGTRGYSFLQSLPPGSRNYYWASTAITAAGAATDFIVALPLADFYDVAEMTAEYDADNNAIVAISNIEIDTYIRNFKEINNLTYYCGTSTAHPFDLSTYEKLDPISRSLNYGNFSYERVLKNGSLETISDPVFVDQAGNQYPETPISALNKKYYKTDSFGKTQITAATNALLSEYERFLEVDAELLDVTDQTKYVLRTYKNDVDFLLFLNKARQGFSITNEDSRAILFSERLAIVINNADVVLRNQEEVVKRMYRNHVILDHRAIENPEFSESSYQTGLTDRDFLYPELYHTNIANYVPMEAQRAGYPGEAELPFSPSELIEEYNFSQNALRQVIQNLLLPNDADFSHAAILESGADLGTKTTALLRLDKLSSELTEWAYETWSSRFIKGSADPVYRKSEYHDGIHYYIADIHPESLWGYSEGISADGPYSGVYPRDTRKWNWGGILGPHYGFELVNPETIVGKQWKDGIGTFWLSPPHFMDMVYSSSPAAGTPYWKPGTFKWGIYMKSTDSLYARNSDGDYQGTTGEFDWDPQATIDRFGYTPAYDVYGGMEDFHQRLGYLPFDIIEPTLYDQMTDVYRADGAERPDNLNPWDHASSYCFPATWAYKFGDSFERFYLGGQTRFNNIGYSCYMNEFFWTATHYSRVSALALLAKEDYQISLYVPKRTDASGLNPDIVDYDPADAPAEIDAEYVPGDDPTELKPVDVEDAVFEDAIEYRNKYFDWIGGIKPLFSNDVPAGRGGWSGAIPGPADGVNMDRATSWFRCARKKRENLHREIQDLINRTYGIDPDTLRGEAGGAALEDRSSTNPNTKLDTFLQEAPGVIGEKVLNTLFTSIGGMNVSRMDTPSERANLANVLTNGLFANFRSELEKYFDNGLCRLYAATVARRPSNVAVSTLTPPAPPPGSDSAPPPPDLHNTTTCQIKYRQLSYEDGDDTRPALPWGEWALPRGISNGTSKNTFVYDFGRDIINAMYITANGQREEIQNRIEQFLETKATFEGVSSDTGIHSALAEVDIVLKKYGYFFFDLEKYIRKNSLISKVLNVDRMLAYFPRAKQMTNAAIKFKEAEIKLHNFDSDANVKGYEVPFFGEMTGQSTFARIRIERDLSSVTAQSSPADFSKMSFYSPIDPSKDAPIAYRKINALQGISFHEITEFTSGSLEAIQAGGGFVDMEVTDTDGDQVEVEGAEAVGILELEGPSGTSLDDPDAAIRAYSGARLGESQDEAAADLERRAAETRLDEVDVTALLESQYAPKDIYSSLVVRNYAFPGFNNAALLRNSWRKDYRLMMFKYQFFTDDDNAYLFNPREEIIESESDLSYDDIEIEIKITDDSDRTVAALADFFVKIHEEFKVDYFQFAEEACAFDAFNQVFNRFFIKRMTDDYPAPPDTPWHRMTVLYAMYQNIFTDIFAGDEIAMRESANSTLEKIRPETGNLRSLREFNDACQVMSDSLRNLKDEMVFIRQDSELDSRGTRTFNLRTVIGNPVVDHIGDYTERVEEPGFDALF